MERPIVKLTILLITFLLMVQLSLTASSNYDTNTGTDFDLTEKPDTPEESYPEWDHMFALNFNAEFGTVMVEGQVYDEIIIDDCYYTFQPGQPKLPMMVLNLNMQDKITDVHVQMTNPLFIPSLKLAPAKAPAVFHTDSELAGESGVDSLTKYPDEQNTGIVPETAYNLNYLGSGKAQEQRCYVYNLEIYPLVYNDDMFNGVLYQAAEVNLELEDDNDVTAQSDTSSSEAPQTRSAAPMGSDIEYMIITTERLKDDLEPLKNWKIKKGITAEIYDIVSIITDPDHEGEDTPDKLRNFIREAYNNQGLKYVLLAGDYNTVPPRMCLDPDPYGGADDGEIPSDTYYACIDEGTTWDTNGNGIYGEIGDLDDIIPDIYVGRIAINSDSGMRNWVDEILRYERNPISGTWSENITLIGTNLFYSGDGAQHSEYLYSKYLQNVYGWADKLYEDSTKGTEQFSVSNVYGAINRGTSFINYMGHGGPTAWTHNYGYSLLMDGSDVRDFRNGGKKPIVFAMSCLTNWFDDPSDSGYGNFGDCIGETYTEYTENGGIAYVGFSRTTVGSINSGYQPYATGLQEDFCRMLNRGHTRIGEIFMEAKTFYAQSWGGYFNDTSSSGEVQACWVEMNLLGDPELPIWTKRPNEFNVSNETMENGIIITVRDNNNDKVENALVCLYAKDELYISNYTNSNGHAIFYLMSSGMKVNLTVTKPNFLPLETKVVIADIVPPETTIEINPPYPDGDNGWYCTYPMINLTSEPKVVTYYRWEPDEVDGNESDVLPYQNFTFNTPIAATDGSNTLYYFSIDVSDNVENEQSYHFMVDTISPQTNITLIPELPDGENNWYRTYPQVYLVSSEDGGQVYCHWGDGSGDVNSSSDGLMSTSPPNEGINTLYYFSEDSAGNREAEQSLVLKIDTLPSDTVIELNPAFPNGNNNWYTASPEISLRSENKSTIYYSWDSEIILGEPSNYVNRYSDELLTVPEGVHDLYYHSIDLAGNLEPPKNNRFKLDTEPPHTSLTITPSEPDGNYGWYTSDVKISLECYDKIYDYLTQQPQGTGTDAEPAPIIYYRWDNSSVVTEYTGNLTVPEGEHTLFYYSEDAAGNTEPGQSYVLKLDTTAPETKIIIDPSIPDGENNWYVTSPTVTFKIDDNIKTHISNDEDEADSTFGNMEVYYCWDNPEGKVKSFSKELRVNEGKHTLYYYSIDIAGNIETLQSYEFKVDLLPPYSILSVDSKSITVGESINFDASESFDVNGIAGYYIEFGDGEYREWLPYPDFQYRYEVPGEYEVILKVKDNAGIVSIEESKLTIAVYEEPDETDDTEKGEFVMVIMPIVIVIIILVAGALMASFIRKGATQERSGYRDHDHHHAREPRGIRSYEEGEQIEDELLEAIIIDKPIVVKVQKVQCPKCNKVFKLGDKRDVIKCPSCGVKGNIK